jgi:hypothetical protein
MLASPRRSSSRGHDIVGVESLMGSFVLAGLMEGPVLVEVLAGAQGAQAQYGLSAGQAPAGAGHIHAVLYQVPTGTLDDSRGDGQSLGKVAIIVQVGRMVEQVARANIYRLACLGEKISPCGAATHAACYQAGLSSQDFKEAMPDPVFQLRTGCRVKRPASIPKVLDNADDTVWASSSRLSPAHVSTTSWITDTFSAVNSRPQNL